MNTRSTLYRAGGLAPKLAAAQHHLEQLELIINDLDVEMRRLSIRVMALQAVADDQGDAQ
jgi:hypothetical protein